MSVDIVVRSVVYLPASKELAVHVCDVVVVGVEGAVVTNVIRGKDVPLLQ